ncbi:hypothetical protein AN958_12048, partial [Leucoagaricus sp. SymC.cos]
TARFVETGWFLCCVLSGVCCGILRLVILAGYNCLIALRKRPMEDSQARLEAFDIKITPDGVLDQMCQDNHVQPLNPYLGRVDIAFLVISLLTDGLLVWRCYAVASWEGPGMVLRVDRSGS